MSQYEIPLTLFFQSSVLTLSCAKFSVSAHFTEEFLSKHHKRLVFRYQIIPPNPENARDALVPYEYNCGDYSKEVLNISYTNGMRLGSGYALTISEYPKKTRL